MAPRQSTRLVSRTNDQHLITPRVREPAKPTDNHQSDSTDLEYTVVRIVRQLGSGTNTRYVVGWYGLGAEDNTEKPPENLPQHFIMQY